MFVDEYPAFKANIFLKHRHVSTILPRFLKQAPVPFVRKRISTNDADFYLVDSLSANNNQAVVLLHGLEGSSQSNYIQRYANYFFGLGYDVHAINFRGCGGHLNLQPYSYHSGFTTDLNHYLNQIAPTYTNLYALGFSLGGNVLLKYLGNQPSVTLTAAAAISVPVDLKGSAMQLDNGFNRFYMNRFIKSLSQKMLAKSKQFPQIINTKGLHLVKNFTDFDNAYTAPLNGFLNADDYWAKCSSLPDLNNITVPTLLVNAKNDPFLSASCFPYDEIVDHPFLHGIFAPYGGHVGFYNTTKNNWLEPIVASFLSE